MGLPTRYDFASTEKRIYELWRQKRAFDSVYDPAGKPRSETEAGKPRFTIVIPPPNVTGRLHMGHALNNTIQDVLIRYKRMDGYDALWVPGTDHAGISTQTVVRKHLDAQGIDYRSLGREKFVERVWEWKQRYGNMILTQLEKLGCSCDWRRTCFTMDEGPSRGVRVVFKALYDRGLLYRGKRIVNWCPVDRTALSDDEVNTRDGGEPGHLWHIRYPLVEPANGIEFLTVATTRPETMFGDVAVAVHPEDERYRAVVGKNVRLPLQGRVIPIIADDYVDRSFGTGCLKITPAHDPNDFELGNRHGLTPVDVMNDDASMNDVVPERFRGLDRFEARREAVRALQEEGLIERVEERMVPVGRAQRSGALIEYRLSDQWFVRMKPLAAKALAASGYELVDRTWVKKRDGQLSFHPSRWEKIYYDWLTNIRDWTISRQIWWGHRIPAWHHVETGEILVDLDTPEPARRNPDQWQQDPDVLDTWFSSWLWPMTTLGWPDDTPDLERYFPTSVLSTSKDIIFFWVARMNFAALEMKGKLPYHDVYIHPTVLDERGAVMSKSKGNGIDPLAVIDGATAEDLKEPIYEARPENMEELLQRTARSFPDGFEAIGADALRFTLVSSCSEGQEMRLSLQRFNDIGRRFITKLWNASRYVLLSLETVPAMDAGESEPAVEDRWIGSRTASTIREVRAALDGFDFAPVGQALYRFVWNDYCDWYLELTKARMSGEDPSAARRAAHTLGVTLADILRLLHPVTPFITEELWGRLLEAMDAKALWLGARPESELLMLERAPQADRVPDRELETEFEALQRVVNRVRTSRANARLAHGVKLNVSVKTLNGSLSGHLAETKPVLIALASLAALDVVRERPAGTVAFVDPAFELYIDLGAHVDLEAERKRIDKEIAEARKKLEQVEKKLQNPKFLAGARQEVVEAQRQKDLELREIIGKLENLKQELSGSAA
ncbi:MAG TPA: valine--tRNA ligase [Vicinamibacteria bacterium]|nr:valine--tRNA ligase [Vicinamibacteria bacterium]